MINLNSIILFNYSTMIQVFMNFIFSDSMLDIIIFYLLRPTVVKMVYFTCDFTAVF